MKERRAYDESKIERLAYAKISSIYKDERQIEEAKKEKWKDWAKMQLVALDLADVIQDELSLSPSWSFNKAHEIINEIPSELIPNINEWIDGSPLSDIKVHGLSLQDIKNIHGDKKVISNLMAVECMIEWKRRDYPNPEFCRYYFAYN